MLKLHHQSGAQVQWQQKVRQTQDIQVHIPPDLTPRLLLAFGPVSLSDCCHAVGNFFWLKSKLFCKNTAMFSNASAGMCVLPISLCPSLCRTMNHSWRFSRNNGAVIIIAEGYWECGWVPDSQSSEWVGCVPCLLPRKRDSTPSAVTEKPRWSSQSPTTTAASPRVMRCPSFFLFFCKVKVDADGSRVCRPPLCSIPASLCHPWLRVAASSEPKQAVHIFAQWRC